MSLEKLGVSKYFQFNKAFKDLIKQEKKRSEAINILSNKGHSFDHVQQKSFLTTKEEDDS